MRATPPSSSRRSTSTPSACWGCATCWCREPPTTINSSRKMVSNGCSEIAGFPSSRIRIPILGLSLSALCWKRPGSRPTAACRPAAGVYYRSRALGRSLETRDLVAGTARIRHGPGKAPGSSRSPNTTTREWCSMPLSSGREWWSSQTHGTLPGRRR